MKKIYIKTTESCQLHCQHCYIGDNRKKTAFFDEEATIAWIQSYLNKKGLAQKDILFSFHGGEPFLCPLDKLEKVCNAFPEASFDATTNLVYPADTMTVIDSFITKNLRSSEDRKPFVKTSWDYDIRFKSKEQELLFWNNFKMLQDRGVRIEIITCLTSLLIKEMSPEEYLSMMAAHQVKSVNFERLTANTTTCKSLIPDYRKQEDWLLRCYEIWQKQYSHIEIEFFRNMVSAAKGVFTSCRGRTCMLDVITINADGSYGGCPNSAISQPFGDIHGDYREERHKHLIECEKSRNLSCLTCDLFKVCNGDCHQLTWQNGICPEPKKLLRRIINDVETEKKTCLSDAR